MAKPGLTPKGGERMTGITRLRATAAIAAAIVTFICSGHVSPPRQETPEARLNRILGTDIDRFRRGIEQQRQTPREMWRQ